MSDIGCFIKRNQTTHCINKKTSQITKAMQMVSAAKLTKSEGASKSFQEYSSKIRSVVTHLVAAQLSELRETEQSSLSEGNYHVMLAQRPVKNRLYRYHF